MQYHLKYEKDMDTGCNSKTLHGSLTIIICILSKKDTTYHLLWSMKPGILWRP